MHCELRMNQSDNTKLAKLKGGQFLAFFRYRMFPELSYEFNARDYKTEY